MLFADSNEEDALVWDGSRTVIYHFRGTAHTYEVTGVR